MFPRVNHSFRHNHTDPESPQALEALQDSSPELTEHEAPTAHWTFARVFYRCITTGPVALTPLFAFFLYQSILAVRDLTLQEFEMEDNAFVSTLLTIMAVYFTLTTSLGDPPSINPIEEAEDIILESRAEAKEHTPCSKSFVLCNKILAIPSFVHFASDNAIALSGLSSNNHLYYLGLGLPLTAFSALSLHILSGKNLEEHSERFIHSLYILKTSSAAWATIFKSPLRSLEVAIESICYIAYQGISAGYIADQLATVFDLKETDPAVIPWILSATLLSAYTAAFTKILPVHDEYFHPQDQGLLPEKVKKTKVPLLGLLTDIGRALTRTGALGWLTYRFGPQAPLKKGLFASSVCLGAFAQSFYVHYQRRKRKIARQQEHDLQLLYAQNNDRTPSPSKRPTSITLFNKLAKELETPILQKAITTINISSRIGQLLSFIGFVSSVFQTINANGYSFPFNFKDTIALSLLWGMPIVMIDGMANQEPLIQTAAYYHAKYLIGAPTEALTKKNILTRTVSSFFYAKNQYSSDRVRSALKKRNQGTENEMMPLVPQPH